MATAVIRVKTTGKADLAELLAQLKAAGVEVTSVGTKAAATGKAFGGMGKQFAAMAAAAVSVRAVFGLLNGTLRFLEQQINQGIQAQAVFGQGMRNVQAVSGATDAELQKLTQTALGLAEATRFTPKQTAEGLYSLASAGLDATQQIAALPNVLNFAEAAQADLGLSTELVTSTMKAFNLEASATARIADVFTAAIGASASTAPRLQLAMAQAAPAGAQLGQSLETVTAAVAILIDRFGSGEMAGTGFKQALLTLIPKAKELGIEVVDAYGNFRDLIDILEDLENSGTSTVELLDIMGSRAGPALSILLAQGSEGLRQMRQDLESNGQAAEVAARQLDTLQGDMDQLGSAADRLHTELGESLESASRRVVSSATTAIRAIRELIEGNSEAIEKFSNDAVDIGIAALEKYALAQAAIVDALREAGLLKVLELEYEALAKLGSFAGKIIGGAADDLSTAGDEAGSATLRVKQFFESLRGGEQPLRASQGTAMLSEQIGQMAAAARAGEGAAEQLGLAEEKLGPSSKIASENLAQMTATLTELTLKGLISGAQLRLFATAVTDIENVSFSEMNELLVLLAELELKFAAAGEAGSGWGEKTTKALNAAKIETEQLRARAELLGVSLGDNLAEAVAESASAFEQLVARQEAYNTLLATGEAVSDAAVSALAGHLLAQNALTEGIERQLEVLKERQTQLEKMATEEAQAAVVAVIEARHAEDKIELPPIEITVEVPDAEMKRMSKEWEEMTLDMSAFSQQAFDGLVDIGIGAFEEIIRTGKLNFEDLWDAVLELGMQVLADLVRAWAQQQFVLNVTGAGGGAGGLGGLFSGAGGAFAAVLGTAAVAAAVYALADGYVESKRNAQYGALGFTQITGGQQSGQYLDEAGEAFVLAIQQFVSDFEAATGGIVEYLPQLGIQITRDGSKVKLMLGDSILGIFGSVEEAINVGFTRALEQLSVSGVAPEIRQLLENNYFPSVEEFFDAVSLVQGVLDSGLSDLQLQLREMQRNFADLREEFVRLGVSTEKLTQQEVRSWQDLRDQITGQGQDPYQQAIRDANAYNQALARQTQAIAHQIEALEAERIALAANANITLTAAQIQQLAANGFANVAQQTLNTINQLARMDAQLASLSEQLAALSSIQPIDPGEIQVGGGGGRRQARESLEQELQRIIDAAQGPLTQAARQYIADVERIRSEVERLHANAELAAEALAVLADQMRQQLVDYVQGALRQSLTGWAEQLQAIRDEAEDARQAREELLAQGEEEIALWKLEAAERARINALIRDVIGSLGLPLFDTQQRFDELAETLAFLRDRMNEGILSASQFGQVLDQVGNQLLVNLGDSLFGFLDQYFGEVEGFEKYRQQLERMRFELELANLKLQFQLILALNEEFGILSKGAIAAFEEIFKWIDEELGKGGRFAPGPPRPPAGGAGTGGGGFVPTGGSFGGGGTNDVLRRIEQAQRLLEQYQEAAMDPYHRALKNLNDDFELIFSTLGRNAETLGAYQNALDALNNQFLDSIRDLRDELAGGSLSGGSVAQQLATAQDRFDQLAAQALGGDLSVLPDLNALGRQIIDLAAQQWGATLPAQQIRDDILALLNALLGITPPSIGGPGDARPDVPGLAEFSGFGGLTLPPITPGQDRAGRPIVPPSSRDMTADEVRRLRETTERQCRERERKQDEYERAQAQRDKELKNEFAKMAREQASVQRDTAKALRRIERLADQRPGWRGDR